MMVGLAIDIVGSGVADRVIGVLDIVIVAYVVYRVLLVIKDTRAFQVLVGMLFVALVYIASTFLGMDTLHWILEKFFSLLILIIVILFQDDIRSGLARVGKSRLFSPMQKRFEAETLGALVKAVTRLAKRKIGALIVIEKETKLKAWLDSGIPVDAAVTHEIISSIFLPTSPIHDGALVIRDGRLLAAGVILPLTQDPRVSKALGTRHRAAIGISEVSDAVVIVVSEEDGSISLVEGGQLTQRIEPEDLRDALSRAFAANLEETAAEPTAPAAVKPTPLGEPAPETRELDTRQDEPAAAPSGATPAEPGL